MKFKIDIEIHPDPGEEEIARDVSVLVETVKRVAEEQLVEAVAEMKSLRATGKWNGLGN